MSSVHIEALLYTPSQTLFEAIEDKELAVRLLKEQNSVKALTLLFENHYDVKKELVVAAVKANDLDTIDIVLDNDEEVLAEAVKTGSERITAYMTGMMMNRGDMYRCINILLYNTAIYWPKELESMLSNYGILSDSIEDTVRFIAGEDREPSFNDLIILEADISIFKRAINNETDTDELDYLARTCGREDIIKLLDGLGLGSKQRRMNSILTDWEEGNTVDEKDVYPLVKLALEKRNFELVNKIYARFDLNLIAIEAAKDNNKFLAELAIDRGADNFDVIASLTTDEKIKEKANHAKWDKDHDCFM